MLCFCQFRVWYWELVGLLLLKSKTISATLWKVKNTTRVSYHFEDSFFFIEYLPGCYKSLISRALTKFSQDSFWLIFLCFCGQTNAWSFFFYLFANLHFPIKLFASTNTSIGLVWVTGILINCWFMYKLMQTFQKGSWEYILMILNANTP